MNINEINAAREFANKNYENRVEFPAFNGLVFWRQNGKRFIAKGYKGRARKPSFHYSFSSYEKMNEYVMEWAQEVERRANENKTRKTSGHTLKVGDVLRTCWGYDQTNVEFYQVTRVTAASVWVREIAQQRQATGYDRGDCSPVRDSFVGKEIMRRGNGESIAIESYIIASKVEFISVAGVEIAPVASYTSGH